MSEEVEYGRYEEAFKAIHVALKDLKKALESINQDSLLTKQQDIDVLLRILLNSPLIRTKTDASGRLSVKGEDWWSGTSVMGYPFGGSFLHVWAFSPLVDARDEQALRSHIAFCECQRNKFTFV